MEGLFRIFFTPLHSLQDIDMIQYLLRCKARDAGTRKNDNRLAVMIQNQRITIVKE